MLTISWKRFVQGFNRRELRSDSIFLAQILSDRAWYNFKIKEISSVNHKLRFARLHKSYFSFRCHSLEKIALSPELLMAMRERSSFRGKANDERFWSRNWWGRLICEKMTLRFHRPDVGSRNCVRFTNAQTMKSGEFAFWIFALTKLYTSYDRLHEILQCPPARGSKKPRAPIMRLNNNEIKIV
jgi:hypothetical protein